MAEKVGRNDLCRCGSGKKYKNCCMDKDQPKLNLGLKARKFTAKVLSGNAAKKEEQLEGQKIMPVDYNVLMERSFGDNLRTYVDKPPIPENPSEYMVDADRNEGETHEMN